MKNGKAQITFLACCNYSDKEKYPWMVIAHARRPHPFGRQSGQGLGIDYYFNGKPWMAKDLFFFWLERFNSFIAVKPERKVFLLLDNCSAHGGPDGHPVLSNVKFYFLPPNTTSHIEPMHASFSASVKGKFWSRLLFRALDNIDALSKSIYKVDVLTAMRRV